MSDTDNDEVTVTLTSKMLYRLHILLRDDAWCFHLDIDREINERLISTQIVKQAEG